MSMPFAGCASVPGGAVVVGGTAVYCPVVRYNRDVQRDSPRWVSMSPLQTPRLHAAVASLGADVYVMVRRCVYHAGDVCTSWCANVYVIVAMCVCHSALMCMPWCADVHAMVLMFMS